MATKPHRGATRVTTRSGNGKVLTADRYKVGKAGPSRGRAATVDPRAACSV